MTTKTIRLERSFLPWGGAISLVLLAACAAAPVVTNGPRPRAQLPATSDAIDDRALAGYEADVQGRSGDDATTARVRWRTAQVRAFAVAASRAMPSPPGVRPAPSGGPGPADAAVADAGQTEDSAATFAPPATLVRQLGGPAECRSGGDADACAARLATELLRVVRELPEAEPASVFRTGLLAALAVLEETSVGVSTAVRWTAMQDGVDAASRLAQALGLRAVTRGIARAAGAACPCREAANLAGSLADELSLGDCADSIERVLGHPSGDGAMGHFATAMAGSRCAPDCTHAAFARPGADPLAEASRACRGTNSQTTLSPFATAALDVARWARRVTPQLEALTTDPAITALLRDRVDVSDTELPTPPPLFVTVEQSTFVLPSAPFDRGHGLEMRGAQAIVWAGATGDVFVQPTQWFSLGEDRTVGQPSNAAVESAALARVLSPIASDARSAQRGPVAVAFNHDASAARALAVLNGVADAMGGSTDAAAAVPMALAARRDATSWYMPVHLVRTVRGTLLRVGDGQVTVLAAGQPARVVALTAPTGSAVDLLGGALREGAPAGAITVALEPDATAATLVRVVDAVNGQLAHVESSPPTHILRAVADGAAVWGVADGAASASVSGAIDAQRAAVSRCLPSAGGRVAGTLARFDVRVSITAQGRVSRVEVAPDATSASAAAASRCVMNAARRWRLPSIAAEASVPVVVDRAATPSRTAAP